MSRDTPSARRDHYRWFLPITTRWMDNDVYGHVNNVTYYSYFDTVANSYLVERGGLDIHGGPVVGFVVSSGCEYLSPIAFPDRIVGGLRVDRLGNSSVRYGIGIFLGDSQEASAYGHFVHVFVDRVTQRPVPIPAALREALAILDAGAPE
jgi:acyl-CoA thioester hydrolase